MLLSPINPIQLHVEQDGGRNYLKVRVPCSEDMLVYNYQIEMIVNNPSKWVIPFEYHRKDDDFFFYYDITSRISLKNYMEKRRFSRQEFIDLLLGITGCIIESRKLLLSEKNFIYNEEYIYLEQESALPGLVYLPVSGSMLKREEFKDLVVRLIARTEFDSGSVNRGAGSFLHKIIEYLKSDEFSLAGFKKLLENIRDEGMGCLDSCGFSTGSFSTGGFSTGGFSTGRENADINGTGHCINKEGSKISIIKKKGCLNGKDRCHGKTEVINGQALVQAAISQAVIIILAVLADWILGEQGIAPLLRYSLIIATMAVYDIVILKCLIFKKPKPNCKITDGSMPDAVDAVNEAQPASRGEENSLHAGKLEQLPASGLPVSGLPVSRLPSSSPVRLEETALLCDSNEPGAFLVCREEGSTGRFRIDKDRFIIGRNPDVCDMVVDSKTVGRIHAEVFKKDGVYYILDKNSMNGTYLNNERLQEGVEYRLNNGDSIVFANVEYSFVIN